MKKKTVKEPLPPYYVEPSMESVVNQVSHIICEKTKPYSSLLDMKICTDVAKHLKGWDLLKDPEEEKAFAALEKRHNAMMAALLRIEAYWIEKKLTKEEERIFTEIITSKAPVVIDSLFKEKTKTDLDAMSTKNLLSYFQAERKRYYKAEFHLKNDPPSDTRKFTTSVLQMQLGKWDSYLGVIKRMLGAREHVVKKSER